MSPTCSTSGQVNVSRTCGASEEGRRVTDKRCVSGRLTCHRHEVRRWHVNVSPTCGASVADKRVTDKRVGAGKPVTDMRCVGAGKRVTDM